MAEVKADPLDDLRADVQGVSDFLAALNVAVPDTVPGTLLDYLERLPGDPVGLAVLLKALQPAPALPQASRRA